MMTKEQVYGAIVVGGMVIFVVVYFVFGRGTV